MPAEVLPLFPIHEPVRLLAAAKVNLFLDVLDRRPDGYHNLEAINVSVDLFDEIELRIAEAAGHRIECDHEGIPTDLNNHLMRAACEILDGTRWGLSIILKKRIPVGAGLGGGTADAGVLIRYLARAFNLPEEDVVYKALNVGSDVPYSLVGGTARVGGRGELIHRLDDLPPLRLLLVSPRLCHETGPIYGRLEPASQRMHPPPELFIEAWRNGAIELLGMQMFNAFQDVVFAQTPELARIRDTMLEKGCLGACLTGTGSNLVGLLGLASEAPTPLVWEYPETDSHVVTTLRRDFPGWFQRLGRN